ncbi:MAG: molecular chaperone DnaK, partial [Actinomycetota bacterium]
TAENFAYSTEKVIKDNDDKLPEDVKTEVQADIDALKTALAGEDIEAVKAANEKLNTSAMKLGEALAAAAPSEEEAAISETASDEDVVDAEVVEDEDDKK